MFLFASCSLQQVKLAIWYMYICSMFWFTNICVGCCVFTPKKQYHLYDSRFLVDSVIFSLSIHNFCNTEYYTSTELSSDTKLSHTVCRRKRFFTDDSIHLFSFLSFYVQLFSQLLFSLVLLLLL